MRRRGRATPTRRTGLAGAVLLAVALAGCADVPTVDPAAQVEDTVPPPAVTQQQALQVRTDVATRLREARAAADPDLVEVAAVGPAGASERLLVGQDEQPPGSLALDPEPATVLVAPQVRGWPRWFAAVTVPVAPSADGAALPVVELYDSGDVRTPYRLWARLTMLPGAGLPAFPAATVGATSLADGAGPSADPSVPDGDGDVDEDAEQPELSEEQELRRVLTDLADRYASVLADGDASPAAAEFEPDAFVEAVRARTEAERTAVAGIARTTVTHEAYGDDGPLYAVQGADGDVLAVTAVETTTTMAVRPGGGVLRPGGEVAAVAGIEQTDGTLTTRSVAALAFVVPAEQGAIRLVAVGEGLVAAEET